MAKRQNMSALQLEDLPDEMLEKVFGYLNIGDLIHCGHVSKRLRNIWNIESLWQSVELNWLVSYGREIKVQTDFIVFLLDKGCQYLNLQDVELTGSLELDKSSKLKRLNKLVLPKDRYLRKFCTLVKGIFSNCHYLLPDQNQTLTIIIFGELF